MRWGTAFSRMAVAWIPSCESLVSNSNIGGISPSIQSALRPPPMCHDVFPAPELAAHSSLRACVEKKSTNWGPLCCFSPIHITTNYFFIIWSIFHLGFWHIITSERLELLCKFLHFPDNESTKYRQNYSKFSASFPTSTAIFRLSVCLSVCLVRTFRWTYHGRVVCRSSKAFH